MKEQGYYQFSGPCSLPASAADCGHAQQLVLNLGLVTTKREDIRDTKKALELFAQQACGSDEFEAKQVAGISMFLLQDRLDKPGADAETAEACRVKSVEDMHMDHLVDAGASMAMVADL